MNTEGNPACFLQKTVSGLEQVPREQLGDCTDKLPDLGRGRLKGCFCAESMNKKPEVSTSTRDLMATVSSWGKGGFERGRQNGKGDT